MVVLIGRLSGQVQSLVRNATYLANALPAVSDIVKLTADASAARETAVNSAPTQRHVLTDDDPSIPILEFQDVTFRYPTRPEVAALEDFFRRLSASPR